MDLLSVLFVLFQAAMIQIQKTQILKRVIIMPTETSFDNRLALLVGLAIFFSIIVLLVGFAMFYHDFMGELKYLNGEIKRTEGNERRYWLRKRRRLWLSIIPFVKY